MSGSGSGSGPGSLPGAGGVGGRDPGSDQDPGAAGSGRGAVHTTGVRHAEDWLLAALAAQADARGGLTRLARPLRIVVPSAGLRTHLCTRLTARRGRALLGVQVDTLYGIAAEILARSGVRPVAAGLVPVLAQRAARALPVLAAGLDPLVDGYGAVVAGVDDLLDAGFEPHHADALRERVEQLALGAEPAARALALVRVAEEVAGLLATGHVGHRAQLYRLACERLERHALGVLPARALWVHGFADATGVQADLVEALVRHAGA